MRRHPRADGAQGRAAQGGMGRSSDDNRSLAAVGAVAGADGAEGRAAQEGVGRRIWITGHRSHLSADGVVASVRPSQ